MKTIAELIAQLAVPRLWKERTASIRALGEHGAGDMPAILHLIKLACGGAGREEFAAREPRHLPDRSHGCLPHVDLPLDQP